MNDPTDLDVDPTAHNCDDDLSCWDEHDDDAPPSGESVDHPLSEPLALVADCAEALQTWASDLAADLRRRGGPPTTEELEEGRELARRAQEAVVVGYVWRRM